MSRFSDYLENKLIDATLRGIAYVSPDTVYLALYTSDPTDADSGTEVITAGTGYERQAIDFTPPVDGVTANSGLLSFPVATTGWGTISHIGIRDSLVGGNLLYHGPITPTFTVNAASRIEFPAGAVQVVLL